MRISWPELIFSKAAIVGFRSMLRLDALPPRFEPPPSPLPPVCEVPLPNDGHRYLEHFSSHAGVKIRDTVIRLS